MSFPWGSPALAGALWETGVSGWQGRDLGDSEVWWLGTQDKQGCVFRQGGDLGAGHCQPIRLSLQVQCLLME